MNIAHILILNKLANIVLLNIHEKVSTVGRLPPMVLDKAQPAHKDRVEYNVLVMFFKQSFKCCIWYHNVRFCHKFGHSEPGVESGEKYLKLDLSPS